MIYYNNIFILSIYNVFMYFVYDYFIVYTYIAITFIYTTTLYAGYAAEVFFFTPTTYCSRSKHYVKKQRRSTRANNLYYVYYINCRVICCVLNTSITKYVLSRASNVV